MKKGSYVRWCCLFVLLALFCACGAKASYSRRVVRQPHNHYFIELRQPGKQNVKALAEDLKHEMILQCETTRFYKAWIRVMRVRYSPKVNETVGTAAFDCRVRQSHLW